MNFTSEKLSTEQGRAIVEKYGLSYIAATIYPPHKEQRWQPSNIFVDRESGAQIFLIPKQRQRYQTVERLLLIWNDAPVYIERSYKVFSNEQKQVVWNIKMVVAPETMQGEKSKDLLDAVKQSVEQFGFGLGQYKRGPSFIEMTGKVIYASAGVSVIEHLGKLHQEIIEAQRHASLKRKRRSAIYTKLVRIDESLNQKQPLVIVAIGLLFVIAIIAGLMRG